MRREVEIVAVLKLLQSPEKLDEMRGAVVVALWLGPPSQQIGASGLDGIVEGERDQVGEILSPPTDERGHGSVCHRTWRRRPLDATRYAAVPPPSQSSAGDRRG